MKGVLTFTVQVWQTDVQVHFYFPSAVFVWVIHVELIHSGGQKHSWVQAQGCFPWGKPKILHGEGEKEAGKRRFDCVMAITEIQRAGEALQDGMRANHSLFDFLLGKKALNKLCTSRKQNSALCSLYPSLP